MLKGSSRVPSLGVVHRDENAEQLPDTMARRCEKCNQVSDPEDWWLIDDHGRPVCPRCLGEGVVAEPTAASYWPIMKRVLWWTVCVPLQILLLLFLFANALLLLYGAVTGDHSADGVLWQP